MRQILLTQEFYQRRIRRADHALSHNLVAQHVGWSSTKVQRLGYTIASDLTSISWPQVKNVLDIGCGYGQLTEYLRTDKHYQGEYLGLDIMARFITEAARSYPSPENQFIESDFLTWQPTCTTKFGVIFCLGALSVNHDYPGLYGPISWQYAVDFITKICQIATSAISLYFPNEQHVTVGQTRVNSTMAFYRSGDLEQLFRNLLKDKIMSIETQSYPQANAAETVMKVQLRD
ncbi:MAG: class I SAM-dependent methyltransferase [Cyanobacteria bacterium P01_H01_bin.121]